MAQGTRRGFGKGVKDDCAVVDQSPKENKQSLAKQLFFLEEELEKEKKRAKMLNQRMEEQKRKYWWENPIENLELDQLQELLRAYLALRDDINKELERRISGVPKVMDLPKRASIPYISNKFWPVKVEASSSASSHDSVNPGTNVGGVVQGGGSSMFNNANAASSSKMKAENDG